MIAYILLGIATLFLVIAQLKNADVVIGPIKGFMVGFLYHSEEYDDDTIDYTLQCLLGVISLNVTWTRSIE